MTPVTTTAEWLMLVVWGCIVLAVAINGSLLYVKYRDDPKRRKKADIQIPPPKAETPWSIGEPLLSRSEVTSEISALVERLNQQRTAIENNKEQVDVTERHQAEVLWNDCGNLLRAFDKLAPDLQQPMVAITVKGLQQASGKLAFIERSISQSLQSEVVRQTVVIDKR